MSLFDDLMKESNELDRMFDQIDGKVSPTQTTVSRQRKSSTAPPEEEPGLCHRLYTEYIQLDKLCMQCAPEDGMGGPMVSVTRRCPICNFLSCEQCLPDSKLACINCRTLSQPRIQG